MGSTKPCRSASLRTALGLALLFTAMALSCSGPALGAVHYLHGGDGIVRSPLTPVDRDGVPCPDCPWLPGFHLDGVPLPVEARFLPAMDATARFGGLADGPHRLVHRMPSTAPGDAPSQAHLFFVDKTPPRLEWVLPTGDRLAASATVAVVRAFDEGSGLAPDADQMAAEVQVDGVPCGFQVGSRGGGHLLVIPLHGAGLAAGTRHTVRATVRDRAGNASVLERSFGIDPPEESVRKEPLSCPTGEGPRVFQVPASGLLPFAFEEIPFPIGLSRGKMAAEILLPLGRYHGNPLPASIVGAIDLRSDHPSIRIQRLEPSRVDAVRFRVEQSETLPPSTSTVFLTLRHPKAIAFEHRHACRNGSPVLAETRMRATEWVEQTLPVFPSTQWTTGITVRQEGDRLVCRVDAKVDGIVDPAASWFSAAERSEWISAVGKGLYRAAVRVPEGLVPFCVHLSAASGRWLPDDGRGPSEEAGAVREHRGLLRVRLGRPRIDAFRFDEERGRFVARVSDEGTAPEDLQVEVSTGVRTVACAYSPGSGSFLSEPLVPPEGIVQARLRVLDRAEQSAEQTVFWGVPATPSVAVSPMATAFRTSWKPLSRTLFDKRIRDVEDAPSSDGLRRVRICGPGPPSVTVPAADAVARCEKWVADGGCIRIGCDASDCREGAGGSGPEPECRWERQDVDPPAIEMLTADPDGRVTARIHDHGAPVRELVVTCSRSSFDFDARTGRFETRIALGEAERHTVRIRARDPAGNSASAYLDLTAPLRPPVVHLAVAELGADANRVAFQDLPLDVLLTAEAADESGIDHGLDRPTVDGYAVPVLALSDLYGEEGEEIHFGALGLGEGEHTAGITVTDRAGLSSTARRRFSIRRSPAINDFRYLSPEDPASPEPVFSARVTDAGGDLDVSGIVLEIDGVPVARDRIFYHPASGYLAADGPIPIPRGPHRARVKATDRKGHAAERILGFVVGAGSLLPADAAGISGMVLLGTRLWEIHPVQSDGFANPGETVRWFFRLRYDGEAPLGGLTATLTPLDPLLRVETGRLDLGDISPGDVVDPLGGFDLRIDGSAAERNRRDVLRIPMALRLTDAQGGSWRLGTELDVYPLRPRSNAATPPPPSRAADTGGADAGENPPDTPEPVPAAPVLLTLDSIPRTTDLARLAIAGEAATGDGADLSIRIRVGRRSVEAGWSKATGRFRHSVALDDGENRIEVLATAPDGRSAGRKITVFRETPYRPPHLSIETPGPGVSIPGCNPIRVSGRWDAGSGEGESLVLELRGDALPAPPQRIALSGSGDRFASDLAAPLEGGIFEVRAVLSTRNGESVTAVRSVRVGACF